MRKNAPFLLILLMMVGLLLVVGCSGTNDSKDDPETKTNSSAPETDDIRDNLVACQTDSDCIVVSDNCGSRVISKNASQEAYRTWITEGPICGAGRYASNPRCENFECTADQTRD